MAYDPFVHTNVAEKGDDILEKEAADRLAGTPNLQITSELLTHLRALGLPWWTPESLREVFTATMRLRALDQRPDIRQKITTVLAGTPPKAARKMTPDFQASLIDQVIDSGDVDARTFEEAFDPDTLVVYMDAKVFWWRFRDSMPWEEDSEPHQRLIAKLVESLLKNRGSHGGKALGSILTPWEVLSAIPAKIWHERIPLDTRVQVHEAMLALERDKPKEAFHAKRVIEIATPDIITAHIQLVDLAGLIDLAEQRMGFQKPAPVVEEPAKPNGNGDATTPATAASSPPADEVERALESLTDPDAPKA